MELILSFLFISLSLPLFPVCPKADVVCETLTMEQKDSVCCLINNGYGWVLCSGWIWAWGSLITACRGVCAFAGVWGVEFLFDSCSFSTLPFEIASSTSGKAPVVFLVHTGKFAKLSKRQVSILGISMRKESRWVNKQQSIVRWAPGGNVQFPVWEQQQWCLAHIVGRVLGEGFLCEAKLQEWVRVWLG